MERLTNKVNWIYVSYYQKLSEDFIKEFSDKVDWHNIFWNQNLTEKLILEFYNKLNWKTLDKQKKINKKQKLYMIMNYREMWNKYETINK